MPFEPSGFLATEFDDTTGRVLRTIQAAGVTDEEIEEDQDFTVTLLMEVGKNHPSIPPKEVIEAMDLAFIGLLVHRHLPYKDADTGALYHPEIEPNNYTFTASVLVNMLIEEFAVPVADIDATVNEASERAIRHMRPPTSFTDEGLALHTHVMALFVIGLLTHRFMPTTETPPDHQ